MTTTGALNGTFVFIQAKVSGVWTSIGGQLSHTLTLNNQLIDVTNRVGSAGYRELLPDAGIQSIDTTIDMIFVSQAGYDFVRSAAGTEAQVEFRVLSDGAIDSLFTGQIASFADTSENGSAFKGTVTIHSTGEGFVALTDAFYTSVSALLAFDGADESTTITDSGPNDAVFTAQGTAQLDTAEKKFGTASLFLDGNSDYLQSSAAPSSWNFLHDGAAFTVEAWLYPSSVGFERTLFSTGGESTSKIGFNLTQNGARQIYMSVSNGANHVVAGATATLTPSTWSHVAATYDGSTYRVFVNGVAETIAQSGQSHSTSDASYTLYIGRPAFSGGYFASHMDDIRITNGVARYTANFTPPTEAF